MKFVTFLLSLILITISAIAWSGLDWNGGWAIYTKSFYQGKMATMILRHHYHNFSDLSLNVQGLLKVVEPIADDEVMRGPVVEKGKSYHGWLIDTPLGDTNHHFHGEMYLVREGADKSYFAGRFHFTIEDKDGKTVYDSGWKDCFIKKAD